ncbi:hypothetical protein V8E55_010035 [Tylopilus felleus]
MSESLIEILVTRECTGFAALATWKQGSSSYYNPLNGPRLSHDIVGRSLTGRSDHPNLRHQPSSGRACTHLNSFTTNPTRLSANYDSDCMGTTHALQPDHTCQLADLPSPGHGWRKKRDGSPTAYEAHQNKLASGVKTSGYVRDLATDRFESEIRGTIQLQACSFKSPKTSCCSASTGKMYSIASIKGVHSGWTGITVSFVVGVFGPDGGHKEIREMVIHAKLLEMYQGGNV